ncbi:NADH-ubiquinone oxidoreductase chain J [hydrothermal vent metagenome]|uniref:NADH-ubiquinone oxidoreductase chain J n=1 Tax=hydrothermal vent metagenome TaxID=652676 RepID=A0A1W1EIC7_9ZZZZ
MEQIAFYLFSVLIIGLFLVTVLSSNVLYAMTSLAAGMVMISGLFFLVGADFLGVVQLVVYVGAIMALYSFGMMFFDATKDIKEKNTSGYLVFFLGGMIAVILVVIFSAPIVGENIQATYFVTDATNPQAVGLILFTKYLIPFEVAAIMLLVAMIAGIILAGKKMDDSLTTRDENHEEEATLDLKDEE